MYYEAIRAAFPDTKIYIDTTDGSGVQTLLPLESFTAPAASSASAVPAASAAEPANGDSGAAAPTE